MSAKSIEFSNGSALPVEASAFPICGLDENGNAVRGIPFVASGTAGSPSSDVQGIQGVNGGTPVPISDARAFGLNGSTYITDTSAHTGTFCAIQALADTVVSTMTSSDIGGTLTSVSIPAGVAIYGTITSITLTSGTVIAYNK